MDIPGDPLGKIIVNPATDFHGLTLILKIKCFLIRVSSVSIRGIQF